MALHFVILPIALVLAFVLEEILSFPVLEPFKLLPDILVAVCVLLVDILQLLFVFLLDLDSGGENSARGGRPRVADRVVRDVAPAVSEAGIVVLDEVVLAFDYAVTHNALVDVRLITDQFGNFRLKLGETQPVALFVLEHVG